MRVSYSAAARADLVEIGTWLEQEGHVRSKDFVDELVDACDQIGGMPRAFRVLFRSAGLPIRRKPWRNYLIFYTVGRSAVEIVHVIHAARDFERIFFPE
ncbi:MAG: type II toxin-antitoxin system RelE/ParE family toxin [Rhizomicrobium sp.]